MTNDNDGMLSRMVKKVSSPGRDLLGGTAEPGASMFADAEKAELKAMIERKRRNDFVRKRELDMLRRIRREGLNSDQANSLSSSSRLDDSDIRPTQMPGGPSPGVKAKIDAIEKQMVGVGMPNVPRATPPAGLVTGATVAATAATRAVAQPPTGAAPPARQPLRSGMPAPTAASAGTAPPVAAPTPPRMPVPPAARTGQAPRMSFDGHDIDAQPARPVGGTGGTRPMQYAATEMMDEMPGQGPRAESMLVGMPAPLPSQTALHTVTRVPARPTGPAPAIRSMAPPPPPAPVVPRDMLSVHTGLSALEVSEIAHDHELDEAVIAFANADFALCERALVQITAPGGARHDHSDSWLVLFDLFRATGQHERFDALTIDYVTHFQRSAPQWFSLPQLVKEASGHHAASRAAGLGPEVAWLCPPHLDVDGVAQLNSQTLQLPQPWVLDWSGLRLLDADAASRLYRLMQSWAKQTLEMRWIGSDRLFTVLQEAAPAGVRDADPAFWMTRLEALRLVNRPDQFDEAAIDYCVTYEVSPPSWSPSRCTARIGSGMVHTQSAPLSVLSDGVTSMMDGADGKGRYSMTTLELSGQLSGDIGMLLGILDNRMGSAHSVHISCALLIRVDFIAAGDLLNWVIGKRAEGRWVRFTDVHRLVALMFGAMGITEHAQVQLRQA